MVGDNSPQIGVSLNCFAQDEICFFHALQSAKLHRHRYAEVAEIVPAIYRKRGDG
jgi:hypothetical protein